MAFQIAGYNVYCSMEMKRKQTKSATFRQKTATET
jgi:hypothetical protein